MARLPGGGLDISKRLERRRARARASEESGRNERPKTLGVDENLKYQRQLGFFTRFQTPRTVAAANRGSRLMRLALSSRPDTRKFPFVPTAHRRPEPRGGLGAAPPPPRETPPARCPRATPQAVSAAAARAARSPSASSSVSRVSRVSRNREASATTAVTAVARHHDSRRGDRLERQGQERGDGRRRRATTAAVRRFFREPFRSPRRPELESLGGGDDVRAARRTRPVRARRTDARAAASPTRTPGRAHAGTSAGTPNDRFPNIPFGGMPAASRSAASATAIGARNIGAARRRPRRTRRAREARGTRRLLSIAVYAVSRQLKPRL